MSDINRMEAALSQDELYEDLIDAARALYHAVANSGCAEDELAELEDAFERHDLAL